jgi:hypothetical protein
MTIKIVLRLAIAALLLSAAACEDSDLFAEKEVPLPGVREPLFPNGVPGVDYNAPPAQPSNSNIPIDTTVADPMAGQPQPSPQAADETNRAAAAPNGKPRSRRANAQPVDPNDPWGGARTAQPD